MSSILFRGEALNVLRAARSDSFDSLVCDPPAGISFMGKDWDRGENFVARMAEIYSEALRVMKPGAYGLVWALPRTSHWTAMALEQAGFTIRDKCFHFFGSGFPKSHDISKAIDKLKGYEREVVGSKLGQPGYSLADNGRTNEVYGDYHNPKAECALTAPASPEAKQWDGWGSALKPSVEEWVLVQKPKLTLDWLKEINDYLLNLEESLCKLSALTAGRNLEPTSVGLEKGRGNFAHELAPTPTVGESENITETGKVANSLERTATLPLTLAALNTSLSIVLSWKNTLDVSFQAVNTYTIETKINQIIDLKTLSFYLSKITAESITQAVSNPSGQNSIVQTVTRNFLALKLFLLETQTLSVQGNVGEKAAFKVESLNEFLRDETDLAMGHSSEEWILIQKPISERNIALNVLKHGVGGLNVDASRIGTDTISTHGNGDKLSRLKTGKSDGAGEYREHTGRFPSHLLLSHSPGCELLGTREVKAIRGGNSTNVNNAIYGEYKAELDHKPCGFGGSDGLETVPHWACEEGCPVKALDEQSGVLHGRGNKQVRNSQDNGMFGNGITRSNKSSIESIDLDKGGGASRFFQTFPGFIYQAKASKRDRGTDNKHPCVKSTALMSYLIRLITPPGGTVLDPFLGSGSTGVAAARLGFGFVGIEREAEYYEIAVKRVQDAEEEKGE